MARTFSELWSELKVEAAAEVAKLKADVVAFEHSIVPVIESDIVAIWSQLKGIAVQLVLEFAQAEYNHMSGNEKQSEVVTRLFQRAEVLSKDAVIQDARMLAQQAYNAVRTVLPAAP